MGIHEGLRKSETVCRPLSLKDRIIVALVPWLGSYLIRALGCTWRVRKIGSDYYQSRSKGDSAKRVVIAMWHDSIITLAYLYRNQDACCMISEHRDGELIARAVAKLGYETARGSSTRGGAAALREILRFAKQGTGDIGITPDGPKGPRHIAKLGAVFAASAARLPLVPVAAASDRSWVFRSWDRHQIPKPFARVNVVVGDEIEVPRNLDEVSLKNYLERLQDGMDATRTRAEQSMRSTTQ